MSSIFSVGRQNKYFCQHSGIFLGVKLFWSPGPPVGLRAEYPSWVSLSAPVQSWHVCRIEETWRNWFIKKINREYPSFYLTHKGQRSNWQKETLGSYKCPFENGKFKLRSLPAKYRVLPTPEFYPIWRNFVEEAPVRAAPSRKIFPPCGTKTKMAEHVESLIFLPSRMNLSIFSRFW